MSKPLIKQKAIGLRNKGYSYSYISRDLGVSKGTLSAWLAKISFVPNDITLVSIKNASNKAVLFKKEIKRNSEILARKEAVEEIGSFSKRDLFMLGIGLYLGEGSKTSVVRVVNSDPMVMRIALSWFRKAYNLRNDNFKLRIHLYPDCDEQEATGYWLKETRLPNFCLQKVFVDKRTNKNKKSHGKLPFGTAHLSIKGNGNAKLGNHFLRKILALIDILAQKAELV